MRESASRCNNKGSQIRGMAYMGPENLWGSRGKLAGLRTLQALEPIGEEAPKAPPKPLPSAGEPPAPKAVVVDVLPNGVATVGACAGAPNGEPTPVAEAPNPPPLEGFWTDVKTPDVAGAGAEPKAFAGAAPKAAVLPAVDGAPPKGPAVVGEDENTPPGGVAVELEKAPPADEEVLNAGVEGLPKLEAPKALAAGAAAGAPPKGTDVAVLPKAAAIPAACWLAGAPPRPSPEKPDEAPAKRLELSFARSPTIGLSSTALVSSNRGLSAGVAFAIFSRAAWRALRPFLVTSVASAPASMSSFVT